MGFYLRCYITEHQENEERRPHKCKLYPNHVVPLLLAIVGVDMKKFVSVSSLNCFKKRIEIIFLCETLL